MIDLIFGVLWMVEEFFKLDRILIGFSDVERAKILIEGLVFQILDIGECIHYQC